MRKRLLDEVQDIVKEGNLESFESEINEKLMAWSSEGMEVSPLTLAAALLKKAVTPKDRGERTEGRSFASNDNSSTQRFFINIGSKDGLDAMMLKDFVSSIVGVDKKDFTDSFVKETFSFFELPKENANDVLNMVNGKKYGSREVSVELSERKPRSDRPRNNNFGSRSGFGRRY